MTDLRKALFRALEKSDVNMLRAVLAQGVSLDAEPENPDPVCFRGMYNAWVDVEVLQCLQAAGIDLHAGEPQYQDTLLHWAVTLDDDRPLAWLIEMGLDVNAQNQFGRTPLNFAISGTPQNSGRALKYAGMLLTAGALANLADKDGDAPLHLAARSGMPEVVEMLLASGADPNAKQSDGSTALHVVAFLSDDDVREEHLVVIDRLLDAGADIEAVDEGGWAALAATGVRANLTVFEHLLKRGADAKAGNGNALRHMMGDDNDLLLDRLLRQGVAYDIPHGEEALRPLGLAAYNGYLYGVKTLLDHGADIEAQTVDGETALLVAAGNGRADIVQFLLERGANRRHIDHYGNTALSWAQRRRDARMIDLLSQ
jgi:uncharacterized protein